MLLSCAKVNLCPVEENDSSFNMQISQTCIYTDIVSKGTIQTQNQNLKQIFTFKILAVISPNESTCFRLHNHREAQSVSYNGYQLIRSFPTLHFMTS